MYKGYMEAMYRDYIVSRSHKELVALVDMILKLLEKRGYLVIGRVEVKERK